MAVATTWTSFVSGRETVFKAVGSGSKFAPGKACSICSRACSNRDSGSPNLARRLFIHSSWIVVDHTGLNTPASATQRKEIPHTAAEKDAGVENGGFHDDGVSVAEVLRLGAQSFKRPAPRGLVTFVRDECTRRNPMVGADHAARENPLLDQVQEIWTRHL